MPNTCFSEITFGQFSAVWNDVFWQKRIPESGTLELTNRCNLNCAHCYCNQNENDASIKAKELSAAKICAVLDEMARRGCLWLLFTGGEPLLRNDFKDIYLYAKKKGFLIILFTNGTLISDDMADFLKKWPPAKVEITLYAGSDPVYARVTATKGAFEKCMEGIRLLRERDIFVEIKTMVISLNRDELPRIRTIVEDFGLKFRLDYLLHRRIDGSKEPHRFRLSSREMVSVDLSDEKRIEGWKSFLSSHKGFKKNSLLFDCGAGRTMFFIDPYGNMSLCSMVLKPAFSLLTYSFSEIWDGYFPEIINRQCPENLKCRTCDIELYCQHCPGWAMIENADTGSVVDEICEMAHIRKEALDNLCRH